MNKLVPKFTGRLRGDCCGCCLQHPPGSLPRARWCFHPLPYILLSNRHQVATALARNEETLSWEKKTAESIKQTACCFSSRRRRRRCSRCRTTPPWTHTQNYFHDTAIIIIIQSPNYVVSIDSQRKLGSTSSEQVSFQELEIIKLSRKQRFRIRRQLF